MFILLCILLVLTAGYFWYQRYTPEIMPVGPTASPLEKKKRALLNMEDQVSLQEAVKIDTPKKYDKMEPIPVKRPPAVPAPKNPLPPSPNMQVMSSKLNRLKKLSSTGQSLQGTKFPAESQTLKKFEAETGITDEEIQRALNQ